MEQLPRHLVDDLMGRAKRQDEDNALSTDGGVVYSVVYVTAEPTFTGVIGGYTTLTDATATPPNYIPNAATAIPSSDPPTQFSTAPTETIAAQTLASSPLTSPAVASVTSLSNNANTASGAVAAASATAGATSGSPTSSTSSGGLSTGAKAGVAIGVIAVVGLLAAFLLWLLGKKRRQREAEASKDNEKSTYTPGPATEMITRTPTITAATAPRLSLRPVSRMLPEFMGPSKTRLSGGNLLNAVGESGPGGARNLTPSPQPRGPSPVPHRPDEHHPSNPFADPQNPFADPEKSFAAPAPLMLAPAVAAPKVPSMRAPSPGGAVAPAPMANPPAMRAPSPADAAPAAAAAAVVPAALTMKATPPSPPRDAAPIPPPLGAREGLPSTPTTPSTPGFVVPGTPGTTGTESTAGNVYRVLMDFVPSMEDELELRSGQLVRLLHEYDDGWALCIRLDRSQQGVVPRTCLAAKPSKPKPAHLNQYARPPPPGTGAPGSRPMSPVGGPRSGPGPNFMPSRPGMPPPGRPMSPAGRPMSPSGRPMTPSGRPMSPAGARRPMSPAGARRPMSTGPRPASSGGFTPGPRPMSPGAFNQAPRPLSPGPSRPQSKRSMSPGPYGGRGGPPPMAGVGRRRSNSATNFRERRNSPVGPSKLGPGAGIAL